MVRHTFVSQDSLQEQLASGADLTADTVDTDQPFRLIMFSNGDVKAIPFNTPTPVPPTGLTATPHIAHVTLTWTAAVTPASGKTYAVFRDNVQIGTTTTLTYRDGSVVPSATYEYRLETIDAYGQRSDRTDPETAFIDPALNVAPTVVVKAWPPSYYTDGRTVIRVCASDPDAQALALELGVDVGFLQATDDPSVWYYIPV